LLFGLGIAFRLLTLVFAISIFMLTTKPKDMIESLSNYFPYSLAFSLTTAFRFIPIFQEELNHIRISQEARGLRTRGFRKVSVYFPIIVPLLAKALNRARYLAYNVESRGFGSRKIRYERTFERNDWFVIFGIVCFGVLSIWAFVL
jgi:energy-coupling factor transport system permease protein